jgi:hypothetical protein
MTEFITGVDNYIWVLRGMMNQSSCIENDLTISFGLCNATELSEPPGQPMIM